MTSSPAARPGDSFTRRLERLAEPVGTFWGLGLGVVASGTTPCTDLSIVRIPRSEEENSDDDLTALLLHEWGHRAIAPGSATRGIFWEILARAEGIRDRGEAVNIASDLLIDRWYLRHPRWCRLFAAAERRILEASRDDRSGSAQDDDDPVRDLFLDAYLRLGAWEALRERLDVPRLPATEVALDALFDSGATLDERVRCFFRAVAPFFARRPHGGFAQGHRRAKSGARGPSARSLLGLPHAGRSPSWDARELVRLLVSSGVRVTEATLAEICGKPVAGQVRARLRVLESLTRVEPTVSRKLSRLRSERFDGDTLWRPGDSMRSLEAIASAERGGLLLPGVTTLRRRFTRDCADTPGIHSICLVVDDSASTQGGILQGELDAAVAVLEAGRRLGALLSAVVFGSEITASFPPSADAERIELLLASLHGMSGGTRLAPALWRAVSFKPRDGRRLATVVFTDSYVFDARDVTAPLAELVGLGPVVLFCVEDHLDEELLAAVATLRSPPRVVRHRPGAPLIDAALEVLDGAARPAAPFSR